MSYARFLKTKAIVDVPTGKTVALESFNPKLFDFQRLIARWALKRGRAAIFADCGLGKTFIQLEWGRMVGGRGLIVAPLCVSQQTIREGAKLGIPVTYAHDKSEVGDGITITNYERLERFDPSAFEFVVLDESSILKSFDGKTQALVKEMFAKTPYRLACTATPAPNDISELANHAEFLGVMSKVEMLATFFVHDEQDWRMKGHAQEAFWKWLASWSVCLRKPSDIGCDDARFTLPPLNLHRIQVESNIKEEGMLFGVDVVGLQSRIRARKGTVAQRVSAAAKLSNDDHENQWLLWCGLNSESEALTKAIPGAVEVKGGDSIEHKERAMMGFVDGSVRVLVTKPSIAGFGMNFQNCHKMAFVGLSDSYEEFYQACRRVWRFGQKKACDIYIVTADIEGPVVENIKHKEAESERMHAEMIKHMKELETQAVRAVVREREKHKRDHIEENGWRMNLGDTCEIIKEIPAESIDFSICSPPFSALYTYTNSDRDMGNSKSDTQFFEHYGFLIGEWLRITKPGRIAAIHVAQVPAMLARDGYIGLKDFRGGVIAAHIKAGWIFHGEITVDKNPQAQAIRTKAKGLTFAQLERDAAWMRPALGDYILLFRKPGENAVPVKPDVTRDEWITYAHPCWYDIRETDTLTVAEAREEKDERHICPLQLGLIDRAVRLWSNKGETVFSPFAGIGSEGYQAILNGRRFIGNELKPAYWKTACGNLRKAVEKRKESFLFAEAA